MENYIKSMFEDVRLIELRAIFENKVRTGLYDNAQSLVESVQKLINIPDCKGIYTTLNSPNPLYFTTLNRINSQNRAVKDADILGINRLPFDFDPVRERDTNATNEQVNLSLQSCKLLEQWLSNRGWPKPLTAMSGNGAHLQYRCKIPHTKMFSTAMKVIYAAFYETFSNERVKFDRTVCNPSRIFRLYGTINRKAPDHKLTPQRLAECQIPSIYEHVTAAQVFDLANFLTVDDEIVTQLRRPPKPTTGQSRYISDFRTLDIVALANDLGLYKRKIGAGKHSIYCPWMTDHSNTQGKQTTDTVVWESQGTTWPQFHCSHNSCNDRGIMSLIQHVGTSHIVDYCAKRF